MNCRDYNKSVINMVPLSFSLVFAFVCLFVCTADIRIKAQSFFGTFSDSFL